MERTSNVDPSKLDMAEVRRRMEERRKAKAQGTNSSSESAGDAGSPFSQEQSA